MKNADNSGQDNEARRARRKTLRTLAEIIPLGADSGLECTVIDMSGTGAQIKLTAPRKAFQAAPAVPENFRLVIPRDNLAVECHLAWRKGDTIGVAFTSSFQPAKPVATRKRAS